MKDFVNNIIDGFDDIANIVIDDLIIPAMKSGKKIAIENSVLLKSLSTIRAEFVKNKINTFLKYLADDDEKTIEFLNSLDKDNKIYLAESINKTIDLNDELQIYINCYLTKQYLQNKTLNYYEEQLYYSLDSLTKNDFENFYNVYKKDIGDNDSFINYTTIDREDEQISIKKFESIGLLKYVDNSQIVSGKIVHYFHYQNSEYSNKLYKVLDEYFK